MTIDARVIWSRRGGALRNARVVCWVGGVGMEEGLCAELNGAF